MYFKKINKKNINSIHSFKKIIRINSIHVRDYNFYHLSRPRSLYPKPKPATTPLFI